MMVCVLNNILHLELTALLASASGLVKLEWRLEEWTIFNSLLDKMPWIVKDKVKYRNGMPEKYFLNSLIFLNRFFSNSVLKIPGSVVFNNSILSFFNSLSKIFEALL